MTLKANIDEPHHIELAITIHGVRIKNPSCLPGWNLTKQERVYLLQHGWFQKDGLYWHPSVRTSVLWDRLQHPERYYETSDL